MDHLDFIKSCSTHGANVNARMKDSTETRTIFTHQWLYEDGATPFLRAAQSGDVELMKLLLAHGADPKIATAQQHHAADGGVRHRLGGGRHLRVVARGQRRGREDAARSGRRSERRRTATAAPRCTARRTRAATTSCSCWSTTAPSSTAATSAAATRSTAAAVGPHLAAGRLRGWARPRRRAVGDRASRDGGAAAQADDGAPASQYPRRLLVGLHHRSV